MPTEKAMALASPGVPHGREEEMIAREQAALERPGNLRAAQALATAHRYLDDPIPAPCRLDHHLHGPAVGDRKSTRLNSSHGYISYADFCLKKNKEHIIKKPCTSHRPHRHRRAI